MEVVYIVVAAATAGPAYSSGRVTTQNDRRVWESGCVDDDPTSVYARQSNERVPNNNNNDAEIHPDKEGMYVVTGLYRRREKRKMKNVRQGHEWAYGYLCWGGGNTAANPAWKEISTGMTVAHG